MAVDPKNFQNSMETPVTSRNWQAPKLRITHNEIERKRRARIKCETDFLHQQLPNAVYRDKLAIFKAGSEQLNQYTKSDSSQPRNLILTDQEYSTCVIDNFDGFGLLVRCSDGMIISTSESIVKYLGEFSSMMMGRQIYEFAASDALALSVIRDNLELSSEERQLLETGQIIGRNFVTSLLTSFSSQTDKADYHLVEFSGDIVVNTPFNADSKGLEDKYVLQALCKILEPTPSSSMWPSGEKLVSLRLHPENCTILEISGRSADVVPDFIIGREFSELISPHFHEDLQQCLQTAKKSGSSAFTTDVKHLFSDNKALYRIFIQSVKVGGYMLCFVVEIY